MKTARPPSVDALAASLMDTGLPQPLCVDVAREAISAGDVESARRRAESLAKQLLRPVINATGVLLHTNLGRAPLEFNSDLSYVNLELDMATGERGSRQSHIDFMLARLGGAEAGLVVNNCSAAVTLILAALARENRERGEGTGVAVSRGELVEIGGGFRVPEVIAESGAKLVEVGTTNRTRLKDYEKAVRKGDAQVILKVHQSNYALKGFTESVKISELAGLGVPVVADIGSGLLDASCPWLAEGPPKWLAEEPAARQSLEAGADLVAFSGDKLFGGPQAGIILGRAELVKKCAEHPLARAFRPGGLVISALVQTALKYLNREEIPFWKMATAKPEQLKARAEKIVEIIQEIMGREAATGRQGLAGLEVRECSSVPGGGTLPEVEIPSFGLAVEGDISANLRNMSLRNAEIPIIARVFEGSTILDLRTVLPDQDEILAQILAKS